MYHNYDFCQIHTHYIICAITVVYHAYFSIWNNHITEKILILKYPHMTIMFNFLKNLV